MSSDNIQITHEANEVTTTYNVPQQAPSQPNQQIIITQVEPKSNGCGTAGFVFALLSLILCWIPVADVVLGILGLLFSFIGIFKSPRGLAITGLILSLLTFIICISVAGGIVAFLAAIL